MTKNKLQTKEEVLANIEKARRVKAMQTEEAKELRRQKRAEARRQERAQRRKEKIDKWATTNLGEQFGDVIRGAKC